MSTITLAPDTTGKIPSPGNGSTNGSSIEITNGKANGAANGKLCENGVKEIDM